MDEKITKLITKEIMEDYEIVRETGITNMFDYYRVMWAANKMNMGAFSKLTLEDYKVLLMNFNKLMKFYDIKQ
jgi:hypothetical protein